ncbi:BTAD domain-containing putative transcriptional regulator [Actinoplanes sp. NPDC051343]|uniref:BTAD domain-containing putative transcriptional regulator n=1 Tax=Actinoplanes sp. NPDC051343 TaxID=3363906 RepID=UPI0037BD5360
MDFRLLGPFEIGDGDQSVTGGLRRQERALLGILLLEADHPVTIDRLADLLWDGNPPSTARGAVHTYVGRLRRALTPRGLRIVTHHDGYTVVSAGHRLDIADFSDRCGRAAKATDDLVRAELYDEALALWRGPLLADVAGDGLRTRLEPALREPWLTAVRRRAEVRLAMGEHERVAADLTPIVERDPSEERLVALLMTALHRTDRRAEALRRYDITAKVLDAELGVPPGSELRALRERVLRRDPDLDRPAAPAYAVRVRDQWLPWNVGGHPALEFCNTYAGWGAPGELSSEWLRGYATLAVWAEQHDLASSSTVSGLLRQARRAPHAGAEVLARARRLRSALYACLTDPADRKAFATVARFASEAAHVSVFTAGDDGLGRWVLPAGAGLALPLHAAARSAADLLADPRRFTVCACPGVHCGWLFLNPSGRRAFCSAATCAERGVRT